MILLQTINSFFLLYVCMYDFIYSGIATYFVSDSVSEDVRVRYYETHQHLQDNRTDYVDLRNIKEALFFLAPLFHGSIQFEKDIWSVIAKTQRLLKESSPVAE